MSTLAPYSYEHPRRVRPFQSPVSNSNRAYNKENVVYSDSPRTLHIEESIFRLERSFQEKFDAIMSRMDKCSDLSIASSRAVGVLSAQIEELRTDHEARFDEFSKSLGELRSSTTRLCSESQNLTMTAIEECCSELMKTIQGNSGRLGRLETDCTKAQSDLVSLEKCMNGELVNVRKETAAIAADAEKHRAEMCAMNAEIRCLFESSACDIINELNDRLDHQTNIVQEKIDTRIDGLRGEFGEANEKQEEYNEETFNQIIGLVDERIHALDQRVVARQEDRVESEVTEKLAQLRAELGEQIQQLKAELGQQQTGMVDEYALGRVSEEIQQVQSSLAVFSNESIPAIYHDVDSHVAQFEFKLRRMVVDLMKELCLDLESDIARTVELVHSVVVQSGIPMPAGTRASWKKFREVIFQKETVGGVSFMRPILGDAILPSPKARRQVAASARHS